MAMMMMMMMMCGSVCLACFQEGYTTRRGSSWSRITTHKTTGIFLGHNDGSNISTSNKKNTGNNQQLQPHKQQPPPVLPPLDVVLARARKRPVSPMLRLQTFLNAPVLESSWLTRSDVAFSILAISIGSKGFALGLVLGKWTASTSDGYPIVSRAKQRLPKEIVQVYPVLLAILMDQLL